MALVELHIDGQVLVVLEIDGIPHQAGVAVAGLVEGFDYGAAVRLIFLFLELLALEEVVPAVGVGVLHILGQLELRHVVVSAEIDVADAYLVALVHVEVHADGPADNSVLLNLNIHLAQLIAFFLVVALDDVYRRGTHIVREFAAGTEVEPFLKVFLLTAPYAGECPAGHPGTLHDAYLEPGSVPLFTEGVHHHGHVFEETLGPYAAHYGGYVLTWDRNLGTGVKAGKLYYLVFREIIVSFHAHSADDVLCGVVIVHLNSAPGRLRPRLESQE